MKKISLPNSTTVRSFIAATSGTLQQHAPGLVARVLEFQFLRTRPKAVRRLGFTERPQFTWEVQAEGETLQVYCWGASLEIAGKIALLAHGWNSNAFDLYPLVEVLRSAGYTVVAADQPGHGHSTGRSSSFPQFTRNLERVARLLPHVDLVVGHSMGAAALATAMTRGLPAGKAILLAPPADLRQYIERFATYLGLQSPVQEQLQRRLELREKVDLDQLIPEVVGPRLSAPALIVCDRQDRETGLASAERYAASWPGAELVVTEGLGHNRLLGDSQVHERLLQFVRKP